MKTMKIAFLNEKLDLILNPLDKRELKTIISAVKERGLSLDWYVLRYDTDTTEYNNEIVFKDIFEAYKEFLATEPSYKNERIELIFAPEDEDEDFNDNIVINYKTFEEAR